MLCQGSSDGLSFPHLLPQVLTCPRESGEREPRIIDGTGFRIKCEMTSLKARLTNQ